MSISGITLRLYDAIRTPGIVLHELSHLALVILIPGIKVENIDITSEIEHSGRYTGTRMFMISYAPLYINAIVSYYILRDVYNMNISSGESYILAALGIFFALSFSLGAIPSYRDAKNPLTITKKCVKNNPISFSLIFSPLIFIFSLPFLIMTYLASRSAILGILLEITFAIFIGLLAFGYIDYGTVKLFSDAIIRMTET